MIMSTTKVSYFVVLMCYVDSEAYFGVFQHIKADFYPQKPIDAVFTRDYKYFDVLISRYTVFGICNYAKVRLFKSMLNTPNQNTSYLKIPIRITKIRIRITKIRLAKSKILRSYLDFT